MEIQKAFGSVLRSTRDERGLTREKLAELADLDYTFIYLLEKGQRQPTLTTIFLLAKAFKIKPSGLIEAVETTNPTFAGRSEKDTNPTVKKNPKVKGQRKRR